MTMLGETPLDTFDKPEELTAPLFLPFDLEALISQEGMAAAADQERDELIGNSYLLLRGLIRNGTNPATIRAIARNDLDLFLPDGDHDAEARHSRELHDHLISSKGEGELDFTERARRLRVFHLESLKELVNFTEADRH